MKKRSTRGAKNTKRAVAPLITDVPTLMQKAQENIDKLEWDNALIYLKQALNMEPDNIGIIDTTASALMEVGNAEEAFPVGGCVSGSLVQLLVKSAQMDPEHNFEKWMNLGQLQVWVRRKRQH